MWFLCGANEEGFYVKPDPDRIAAIAEIKPPTTKTGVRAFLGMVRQLESWTPNLSFLLKKLRALTHQNTHFMWTDQCRQEFQIIEKVVGQVKFLTPFDIDDVRGPGSPQRV